MSCYRFGPALALLWGVAWANADDQPQRLLPEESSVQVQNFGEADCSNESTGLINIADLGFGKYLGQFSGGYYLGGSNIMPVWHKAVVPDLEPINGKVVMMSLGMSNTTDVWCYAGHGQHTPDDCDSISFSRKILDDPTRRDEIFLVDGALNGEDALGWAESIDGPGWLWAKAQLELAGVSETDVQVIWILSSIAFPSISLPSPNADALQFLEALQQILVHAKIRYPNLNRVYISNRVYSGYSAASLNPEPYAYEYGFAIKWVVGARLGQTDPWVAWGPDLWADGAVGREHDELVYGCDDFQSDGLHLDESGIDKITDYMVDWFRENTNFMFEGACKSDRNDDGFVNTIDLLDFLGSDEFSVQGLLLMLGEWGDC